MPVSVIIPALNEAAALPETLRNLRDQRPHEVIVVDGGSTDATRDLAAAEGATVLTAPPGRAAQMNVGAARATGDVFLFLHADCQLDPGAIAAAERALARRGVVAGCFTMRVRADGWLYRSIDACATARVRLTGLAYGDQGLFLRRSTFERVGGFPPVRLMEDVLLSRALRRLGRVVVLPQQVHVSPRRWQKEGLVRQTLRNWALTAAAAAGVPPDRLARFYPAVR
jgi:rSAM/selenodomain-associated transferase 2